MVNFTNKQTNVLVAVSSLWIFVYLIIVIFMIYMTFALIIKYKKYSEWHLTSFYVFSYGVMIFRLIDLGAIIGILEIDDK